MANKARGEVAITIEDRPYTLCLTLGALAEIEEALGVESSDQLGARLKGVRMRDMIAILGERPWERAVKRARPISAVIC